jgi:rhamnogalacturonyl hydrolase YesR
MLQTFEIVPQDMPVLVGDWTNYTREEAGFGVEAFAELYRSTGDENVRAVGHQYIDGLIEKLEMPNGLWYRHWWRNTRERTACEYKSRSLGWAQMGLQAAHRMSPERGYLERAVRLADHFLAAQDASGAWGLVIDRPLDKTEVSAKGTALWSMLFYRLYLLTGDPKHLDAARRALRWLIDRQYDGPDPDGEGGVISCSAFSGVNYRRWFKLSCAYTSAFFGLAALEELSLQ